MGFIRWVGKSFQIVGSIMSAEAFEDWCKAELEGWIAKNGEDLAVGWFARRTRSKRKARREISAQLQGSEEFRKALAQQLNQLPRVFDEFTAFSAEVPLLTESALTDKVVVVPRAIVIDMFSEALCNKLSQSRELGRLTHFADFYLRRVAEDAEGQLFRQEPPYAASNKSIVLGATSDFPWPKLGTKGHYYVDYSVFGHHLPDDEKARKKRAKEIASGVQSQLQRLQASLGTWPPGTISEAVDTLLETANLTVPG